MHILRANNIKAYYFVDDKTFIKAVDNVNLYLNEGEIYSLAGESGCGKTTLIKILYGLVVPPLHLLNGDVLIRTERGFISIFSSSGNFVDECIRWKFISYIPQASMNVLNPLQRVSDIFLDVLRTHGKDIDKREALHISEKHLVSLGLPREVLKAFPHQLSGGMRQRVVIALATILKPRVLIADEPTTALDVVTQRSIIQLFEKIKVYFDISFILVSHDMGIHAKIADRIGIMYAGKIVEEAPRFELFLNPLHPYTKFLIDSLPRIGDKTPRKGVIGSPPSLQDPPPGCRFHPRCDKVVDICRKEVPALVEISKDHKVACFLYSKEVEEDDVSCFRSSKFDESF